jgi:hypothetical protein
MVAFIAVVLYGLLEWHHSSVIANKDSTIENQRTRIAILEGELKGASPQLAAIQARRAASREHLLDMYISAGSLIDRGQPTPENLAALGQLEIDIDGWSKQTAKWLDDNLGPAARERFMDVSNMPSFGWSNSVIPTPAD